MAGVEVTSLEVAREREESHAKGSGTGQPIKVEDADDAVRRLEALDAAEVREERMEEGRREDEELLRSEVENARRAILFVFK